MTTSDEKRREDAERYYHETPHKVHVEDHTYPDVIDAMAYALKRDRAERKMPDLPTVHEHNESTRRLLESGNYPEEALKLQVLREAMQGEFFNEGYKKGLAERDTVEAGLMRLAEDKRGVTVWQWKARHGLSIRIVPRGYRKCHQNWYDTPGEAVKKAVEEMEK